MCEAELSFTLEPSDIIAVQEQPLMLHCQVDGIPPITTQWRRNGLLLTQDQHHTTFINGSLLIAHFQKTKSDGSSDEGDYECIAQNSFGLVVSRKARIQAASKSFFWSSAYINGSSSEQSPVTTEFWGVVSGSAKGLIFQPGRILLGLNVSYLFEYTGAPLQYIEVHSEINSKSWRYIWITLRDFFFRCILDLKKKKSPADGRVEEVSFTLELADHDYDWCLCWFYCSFVVIMRYWLHHPTLSYIRIPIYQFVSNWLY